MLKLKMLKPRIPMLEQRFPMVKTARTLKDKRESNGRTLALDGAAWKKLRAYVLSGEPLCRHCTARGLTVVATEVDHRNGPADNRLESLQPLCKPCHSKLTNADLGRSVSMGCDSNGMPLDPVHPWNSAPEPVLMRPDADLKRSPATDSHLPTVALQFNANRKDVA